MRLEWLRLHDFRNVRAAELTFAPGLNRITGENGQGKSNLLEAIGLLASGRSFRRATAGQMRRWEQTAFRVSGAVHTQGWQRQLDVEGGSGRQVVRLDGKPVVSVTRMERVLVTVILTPETPQLVRGGPAERRAFLDWVIFGADRRHGIESADYQTALRSRLHLLKQGCRSEPELEVWEWSLARLGARIASRRHRAVGHLMRMLPPILEQLGVDPEQCTMRLSGDLERWFQQDVGMEEVAMQMRTALARGRERDRVTGTTSVGPQRDDLELCLSGHPVARFGSRGQQQRLAFALKLAEAAWLEELLGEPLVMLLDDPVAELDRAGAHGLMTVLSASGRQLFVASREAGEIPWPGRRSLECAVVAGAFQVSMEQAHS
ncbi:MAG: DNA replication/repair protein RecF [Magnetococcales bacterium]|nr:DNA replication/repair protein RecF [Magnetococcales bacterium]